MSAQTTLLHQQLDSLKLPLIKDQYNELAQAAAQQSWSHVEYLSRLVDAQYQQRLQRTIQHRIQSARFPVLKPWNSSNGTGPRKSTVCKSKTSSAWSSWIRKRTRFS